MSERITLSGEQDAPFKLIQYFARTSKGDPAMPQQVIMYGVCNGFVFMKESAEDWNIVAKYPNCFVDMFSVGEHKLGDNVGAFPFNSKFNN